MPESVSTVQTRNLICPASLPLCAKPSVRANYTSLDGTNRSATTLMREVCFILVGDKVLRAYLGSQSRIPDLPERWQTIWNHRNEITEIAHSHPGEFLDFSHEDLTTMEAVEAGTGKKFV